MFVLNHLDTIIGVGISVLLFYISYRQTIGAAKERIQAANSEIDSTIFKRTVLEGLSITPPVIRQLTEGKALQHRVRSAELHSVEEILSILLASTLESDFVPESKRAGMIQAIVGISELPQRRLARETEAVAAELTHVSRNRTDWALILMAVVASFAGGVSSVLPGVTKISGHVFDFASKQAFLTALSVSVASLGILLAALWVLRLKSSEEESARSSELRTGASFEHEVLRIFRQLSIPTRVPEVEAGYDFDAQLNGKKTLVEVKSWNRRVPLSLIHLTMRQMKRLIDAGKGEEAILVLKDIVAFPSLTSIDPRVKLVSLRQLKSYLAQSLSKK
jgi:hypothetical protein